MADMLSLMQQIALLIPGGAVGEVAGVLLDFAVLVGEDGGRAKVILVEVESGAGGVGYWRIGSGASG